MMIDFNEVKMLSFHKMVTYDRKHSWYLFEDDNLEDLKEK